MQPSLHVMQVAVGPTLKGLAPPIPDSRDPVTALDGCKRRFCVKPPPLSRNDKRKFRTFVRNWLEKNMTPLERNDVLTFDEWLDSTSYPEWRKRELRREWERVEVDFSGPNPRVAKRYRRLNSFVKVETYKQFKPARAINARSDAFKVFSGRFFKSIEQRVFKDPHFIKHVPVKDRSAYLDKTFEGWQGPYYQTDYSHFESHFTAEYMSICEFQLYKHMMKNYRREMDVITSVMASKNECNFKGFSLSLLGVRMSGEMCTSLGNGFANLMNTLYLVSKKGGKCVGVVEGDDGLFASTVPLTKQDYAGIGFDIKIELFHNYRLASFCGIVASVDGSPLTEPRDVLMGFGWSHSPCVSARNAMGLCRAKALSLLYEHPNCPILTKLALRYIALTSGSSPIFSYNWYDMQLAKEVSKFREDTRLQVRNGISPEVRKQFEECYNIPVYLQLKIEDEIETWGFGEVDSPLVLSLFEGRGYDHARTYYARYVGNEPWGVYSRPTT